MADQTESSITVAADRHAVMSVIAALEDYPIWNEEIREVEVLRRGTDTRPVQARFVIDAGVIKDDYVLEYRWDDDRSATWSLLSAGMLTTMDGSYSLSEQGGATTVTYRLTVDVRVPMIGMIKRKAERVIVERALNGLRRRVEAA